jgi:hypothetical protein
MLGYDDFCYTIVGYSMKTLSLIPRVLACSSWAFFFSFFASDGPSNAAPNSRMGDKLSMSDWVRIVVEFQLLHSFERERIRSNYNEKFLFCGYF